MPVTITAALMCTPVVGSCDPNEIVGPSSYGSANMVAAKSTLPFTIHFENDSLQASTAAQRVVIRQKIHPNLNPLSFRVADFGFANKTFKVTQSPSSYFKVLNLVDSLGFNVEFTAGVDVVNRELVWVFQTIDPATGLAPSNPLTGFLPINNLLNDGQGFVNYTIRAISTVQTGDSITAKADIVFDNNDPIPTNNWINIIDAVSPTSVMNAIPPQAIDSVLLSWKGTDDPGGSGVGTYSLYVSINGGPYNVYKAGITDTSLYFIGSPDSTYCFFTRAADNVDNLENLKNSCEAQVKFKQVALPITWLYFTGQRSGANALLKWATTSEINAKYFELERSVDGVHFSKVGQVNATGNSNSTNNYNFINVDAMTIPSSILYYRLRQVDADGNFTYSIIISIRITNTMAAPAISAYPNPFSQSITLKIIAVTATDQTDNVSMHAMDGRLLYQRKLVQRGSATILLDDLPTLNPGIYLLKTIINGKMYTIKLMRK